jgi:hypothetical protein
MENINQTPNLLSFAREKGFPAALRYINKFQHAMNYEQALAWKKEILESEGEKPFAQRSPRSQYTLRLANMYMLQGHNTIYEHQDLLVT